MRSRLHIAVTVGRAAMEGTAGFWLPLLVAPSFRRTTTGTLLREAGVGGSGNVPSGASLGMPREGPTHRPGRKARGRGREGGAAGCVAMLTKPGALVGRATRPLAV